AVVADAIAALVDVADVGRGAADGRALGIRGTGRARPVTVLLEVAGARRGTARGAGGDEGVGGTGVRDAVAARADGAGVGRGGEGARGAPAPGAGSDAAHGRTVVPAAVAALGHVADARCGPADGGALGVGGTVDARPRAVFRHVAHAGRRPAQCPAWRERVRG